MFERAAGIHKVNKEKIIKTNKTEKIENRLISLLLKSVMNGFKKMLQQNDQSSLCKLFKLSFATRWLKRCPLYVSSCSSASVWHWCRALTSPEAQWIQSVSWVENNSRKYSSSNPVHPPGRFSWQLADDLLINVLSSDEAIYHLIVWLGLLMKLK